MSNKHLEGLGKNQKIAIILAVAIIVFVIAAVMFFGDQQITNSQDFSDFLYSSNKSGIIMDVRDSPSLDKNSVVIQCGVNLISGGFYAQTQKDLLVYACDDSGCISSAALANLTNDALDNSTINSTALLVPFDQALYDMRSRAYFHIMYSKAERKIFHPTYVEVYVNSSSDPSKCGLVIKKN